MIYPRVGHALTDCNPGLAWEHTTICVAFQMSLLVACGVGESLIGFTWSPVLKRKIKEIL